MKEICFDEAMNL